MAAAQSWVAHFQSGDGKGTPEWAIILRRWVGGGDFACGRRRRRGRCRAGRRCGGAASPFGHHEHAARSRSSPRTLRTRFACSDAFWLQACVPRAVLNGTAAPPREPHKRVGQQGVCKPSARCEHCAAAIVPAGLKHQLMINGYKPVYHGRYRARRARPLNGGVSASRSSANEQGGEGVVAVRTEVSECRTTTHDSPRLKQ